MVAPRFPTQPPRQRRKRSSQRFDQRVTLVLLIPVVLAFVAIGWNVVRLIQTILRSKRDASLAHRQHAKTSSWNYNWCRDIPTCRHILALDLQDLLHVFHPEDEEESFFEDLVPDPQEVAALFEFDDDNGKQPKRNNHTNTNNFNVLTDDLDNHPDHFGQLVMDSAARFDNLFHPTPRVLGEARRNKTLLERANATQLLQQLGHNSNHFALLSRRGLGDSHFYNQDRAILIDPFPIRTPPLVSNDNPLENNFFLSIFDGHGPSGHVKADHAAAVLPNLLLQQLSQLSSNGKKYSDAQLRKAFSTAFWQVHRQGPLIHDSGCTASVIVRFQQALYFANAGDSKSMLVHIDPQQHYVNITHMTHPHKPDHPPERQRIVRAGCVVLDPIPFHDPTARVTASLEGFGMALAMSRSIGDYDLEPCGVIPEPTVTVVDLTEPRYRQNNPILLAVSMSDGIMDMVSLREVAQVLAMPYWGASDSHPDAFASSLELAVEDLIRVASDRWVMNTTFAPYRDDITIAVRRVL